VGFAAEDAREGSAPRRWRLVELRPHQMLVLGFAACVAFGALLLMLPAASRRVPPLRWDEAVFTATSAVCVTGLTVVDTGSDLSPFGQAIVLVLIQVGGLGIMTFSTLLLFAAGGRPSLAAIEATGQSMGVPPSDIRSMVRSVVLVTFALEMAGALALFALFARTSPQGEGLAARAWSAVFHSVSAFCNAGFSLRSEGLERYRDSWGVCAVFMVLILAGGIGFPVLREAGISLRSRWRSERRPPVSLHAKLALSTSVVLLVLGAAAFLATEWSNPQSLASLPLGTKVLAAVFQSTAARTAGFSTVQIGSLAPATLLLLMFLMFVGASPCSTGGGIKTTTLGVLAVTAASKLRGHEEPRAFGRSLPGQVISRAVTVLLLSGMLVLTFVWFVLVAEGQRFGFGKVAFEAVSAFGTVGLSTGITKELGTVARMLLVVLMFAGRLGPLTLVVSVSRREGPERIRYPSEGLLVG